MPSPTVLLDFFLSDDGSESGIYSLQRIYSLQSMRIFITTIRFAEEASNCCKFTYSFQYVSNPLGHFRCCFLSEPYSCDTYVNIAIDYMCIAAVVSNLTSLCQHIPNMRHTDESTSKDKM